MSLDKWEDLKGGKYELSVIQEHVKAANDRSMLPDCRLNDFKSSIDHRAVSY